MIEKKEIQYKNYGKCLEISNDTVKIIVTLDVGPRIICYSFLNGENILFEDTNRVFQELNPQMEEVYGKGKPWIIYGGHRLWKSPEMMPDTYYPDNNPVDYRVTEKGAVFIPPVQEWTNYGYEIEVELRDSGSNVTVKHRVTNHGDKSFDFSIWPITVLSPGGVEVVPQPFNKTGAIPRMGMTFWFYDKMMDERLVWLNRYILLKQDKNGDDRMKFGINNEDGFAMYFNHGDMFLKEFDVVIDGNYPDGGMSFETYTNPLFLEMESLGELKVVAPRETISHTERWSLYKQEMPRFADDDIDALREKYIK